MMFITNATVVPRNMAAAAGALAATVAESDAKATAPTALQDPACQEELLRTHFGSVPCYNGPT